MPHFRVRTGAVLCGVATLAAGCAQEPGVVPGTPDNCILICAVVRSLTASANPTPSAQPMPLAKTREAKKPAGRPIVPQSVARADADAGPPLRRGIEEPAAAATPIAVAPPAAVASRSAAPSDRAPKRSAAVPPSGPGYLRMPGSAPIELVTSRFVPRDDQRP